MTNRRLLAVLYVPDILLANIDFYLSFSPRDVHLPVLALVLLCGNFDEFSTHSLRQCRVVVSQRCHRIVSFLRLALTQISGTDIHRYFHKAVLV